VLVQQSLAPLGAYKVSQAGLDCGKSGREFEVIPSHFVEDKTHLANGPMCATHHSIEARPAVAKRSSDPINASRAHYVSEKPLPSRDVGGLGQSGLRRPCLRW